MRRKYTPEQIDWIREHAQGVKRETLRQMFNERFGTDVPYTAFVSLMSNHRIINGLPRGGRERKYTAEMIDWLRAKAPGVPRADLCRMFNDHFGLDVNESSFRSMMKKHEIRNGRRSGAVHPKRKYTDEQIEWLRQNAPGIRYSNLLLSFTEWFGLEEMSIENFRGVCKYYGITNRLDGRFEKGAVPWNKGKKGPIHYTSEEKKKSHQSNLYKPGQIPLNWMPVGTEREVSGYIYVKVSDIHKPEKIYDNWMPKHRKIWLDAGREIPNGWVVIFLDGNKRNFEIDNLLAVPNAAPAIFNRRYGGYTDDPEVNKTNWLMATIDARSGQREKEKKKAGESGRRKGTEEKEND